MSTIWTPSGEHVPRNEPERPSGPTPPPGGRAGAPPGRGPEGGPEGPEPTPEEIEAVRQQVREVLARPVVDHLAGYASGLLELAALHLQGPAAFGGSGDPDLTQAALAIDALGALVEGLGDRWGRYHEEVTRALSQLRLAYVEAAGGPPG